MQPKCRWILLALLAVQSAATAQTATLRGMVRDGGTGEALPAANLFVLERQIGTVTNIEGNYVLEKLPIGTSRVRVSFVGYKTVERVVTLSAGVHLEDFALQRDYLGLDEIVVTGVTAETPRKKLAFTVDNVSGEKLELAPTTNPIASLAGKVVGATIISTSGEPGRGVQVRLRGTTSLTGSSEPLYIVDGVILAANQVDIDALDVEGIEVVKGAAASSLYGARAQNGVIQIATKRGKGIALGQTRLTVRNEYGRSFIPKTPFPNMAHDLRTDDAGNFLNSDGTKNSCDTCLDNGYGPGTVRNVAFNNQSFYDTPYSKSTSTLYNPFDEFFEIGASYTNYVALSQNSARTNFHASITNVHEGGVVHNTDGYDRKSVRINLDHQAASNFDVAVSGFYSQSMRDSPEWAAFAPFFGVQFTVPLVSLLTLDEDGRYKIQADPLAVEENPIYLVTYADQSMGNSRVLGNFRTKYSPLNWLDLEAGASYDRSDRDGRFFYDRGYATMTPNPRINNGRIERFNAFDEAFNGDVMANLRRTFGQLTTRLQLKYQAEAASGYLEAVNGWTLTSAAIPDLSNVNGEKEIFSQEYEVLSDGIYATFGFDYADKYIGDVLFRRDGSSLFGEDERWQSYYRVSAAYRVSEEVFWPLKDLVPEFKLRASLGTAGGRPGFEAQYETFVLLGGLITKGTLGNRFLKPELQTELEVGVNFSVGENISFDLTYSDVKVEDLLLSVPLAGPYGFSSQWRNAGALASNTIEASMNAVLFSGRDRGLDLGIRFDRTKQEITDFESNPYRWGPPGCNDRCYVLYYRKGEVIGQMYGAYFMTDKADLSTFKGGLHQNSADLFAINDEGYLVPIGAGNTTADGIARQLWGTNVNIDGTNYAWGIPIKWQDEKGATLRQIGNILPDFSLSTDLTLRYKGFNAYMLWSAQIGGDVYNMTRHWAYRDGRHADQDQLGKSDAEKKPRTYYEALYNISDIASPFVENGTFMKLREMSVGYTFERRQLSSWFGKTVNRLSFAIIGRNLLTFSGYTGFDPEIGSGEDGTIMRVDNFAYPQFRSLRGKIEIQF
jgi:TonB-linked SusC/RagA family outer membrane protein